MPGLKPALYLCLGNACEPQQHMPLVKQLSAMGTRGNLTQSPQFNGSEENLGKKPADRRHVVRLSPSAKDRQGGGSCPPRSPRGRGCAACGNITPSPVWAGQGQWGAGCRQEPRTRQCLSFSLPRGWCLAVRACSPEGAGRISHRSQGTAQLMTSRVARRSEHTFTWPYIRPPSIFPIVLIIKGISQVKIHRILC